MPEQMEKSKEIGHSIIGNRLYALEQRCIYLESELRLLKEKVGIKCSN
jgi:hypothetical protein